MTRTLRFGYPSAVPAEARAAWGARLIMTSDGGDLLHDRQDGWFDDDDSRDLLHGRLNRVKPWHKPLGALIAEGTVRGDAANEVVVFEDDLIKVVGNSNGSYGYFYMAGWLK